MPKCKAAVIPINARESLVGAVEIAKMFGFTTQYINRMAAAGKIPWHGIRNGSKVYRRFDVEAVKVALGHEVKSA